MSLRCHFHDKYRFYQAFLLPQHTGYFIPTDEACEPGAVVPLEVQIKEPKLELHLEGKVTSRRAASRGGLSAGLTVVLTDAGSLEAQSLLDLTPVAVDATALRRYFRYPITLLVTLVEPFSPYKFATLDLGRGGMRVEMPIMFKIGLKLVLAFSLGARPFEVKGRLLWVNPVKGGFEGGIEFDQPLDVKDDQLNALALEQFAVAKRPDDRVIIVADDDPEINGYLRDYLQHFDFKVFTVGNGEEAVALARQLNPTLLVLDIRMPRLNGLDVCRILQRDAHLARIPVIFISAMEEAEIERSIAGLGAFGYLAKPFQLAQFKALIERAIGVARGQA